MEFTFRRTAQITGLLLLIAAVTQAIYTALYVAEAEVPLAMARRVAASAVLMGTGLSILTVWLWLAVLP